MALSETPLFAAYVVREGEGFIFLSPDGDSFLEVNMRRLPPELNDEEAQQMRKQVINLMDGKTADGEWQTTTGSDGKQHRFKPMRYARRWFSIIAHEEKTSDSTVFEWDGEEWITDQEFKFQGKRPERLTAPEPL